MNSAKQVDLLVADLKSKGIPKVEAIIKTAEACVGWSYVWGAGGALCTPAKREYYAARSSCPSGEADLTRKKCQVLNGSKSACNGCKWLPGGEKTEIHDCWGFVKDMLQRFGINLAGCGCTSGWNTKSNWAEQGEIKTLPEKLCCVFWADTSDKSKKSHIGFYIGNGMMVHCSGEVKREKLSARCTHWAIPKGLDGDIPVTFPTLRKGSKGEYVTLLQTKLIQLGYDLAPYGADGAYGNKTLEAVKCFQRDHGLTADGITGAKTWEAILNSGGQTLFTVTIPHLGQSVADEIVRKYGGTMTKEGD